MPDGADEWLDALDGWDYRMTRDSRAALFFERWFGQFRAATWGDEFGDLDESYYPNDWVLATLAPDSEFFDGDRAGVLAGAAEATVAEIDEAGWETYGDYNRTAINHPFGGQVDALNYPRYPTDGSPYTVMNFRKEDDAGSSWRMVASPGDESFGIVPGGNDGSYFSEHYDDQLRAWADGEYRRLGWDRPEGADVTVREGDG
jgi:penicillin amidase